MSTNNNTNIRPNKRHKARRFAVQALYQWQLTADDTDEIALQFLKNMNHKKADADYFRQLLIGVSNQTKDLDVQLIPFLDRAIADVGPVELAILRLATYELKFLIEIPYKVVLNEAIELAKAFAPQDADRYINGVLDKIASELRDVEVQAAQ